MYLYNLSLEKSIGENFRDLQIGLIHSVHMYYTYKSFKCIPFFEDSADYTCIDCILYNIYMLESL